MGGNVSILNNQNSNKPKAEKKDSDSSHQISDYELPGIDAPDEVETSDDEGLDADTKQDVVTIRMARDQDRDRDARNPRKIQSKEYRAAKYAYTEQVKHIKNDESTLIPPPVRPIKANLKPTKVQKHKPSHYDMVQEALDIEFYDLTNNYLSDPEDDEIIQYDQPLMEDSVDEHSDLPSKDDRESDNETGSVIIHESDIDSYETEYEDEIETEAEDDPSDPMEDISDPMEDIKALRRIDRFRDHHNADKLKSKEHRFAREEFVKQSKKQEQGDELEQPPVRPIKNYSSGFFMEKRHPSSKYETVRDALIQLDM